MDELLKLIKNNAKESPENLAKLLGTTADEVRKRIDGYEKAGIIQGYQTLIDEEKLDSAVVTAVIEVRLTAEREGGFNRIAERISRFPEVRSSFLMSGGYDLLLFVSGKTLNEVASFVSEKLSPLGGVVGTATHFMLKTYKKNDVLMRGSDENERLSIS
ncbi:MAG: Lrp/AsnC family transcriptional regulator [Pontiellaceae bacterium]|jgi:DNA-binding Lrp family transcriptional regulator|nr:Lrp/AsnC family transcriptional regulator [Pontiellaceae bacterium]